jgi:hypothetical protein
VPLREGYRWVFGFLILYIERCVSNCVPRDSDESLIAGFNGRMQRRIIAVRNEKLARIPVLVRLFGLVVLRRVL